MNTFLNAEQEALVSRYRSYVTESIRPLAAALEQRSHSLKDVLQMLGHEGFLSINVPKEYGGQGNPFINLCLFIEQLSRVDAGTALAIAAHQAVIELIVQFGTSKQKSRYLPLLARGECIGTFAFAEENAGSDYSAVQTVIETNNAEDVSISGKKTWVVNGDIANLIVVCGRFEKGDGQPSRLCLWLVDRDDKAGINVFKNRNKLGLRSASTNDIEFSQCKAASDAFLGPIHPKDASDDKDANEQIMRAMDIAKVIVAASAIGLLDEALHKSVEHAKAREQFGANIGKLQAIQWKLADMSAESSAARFLTYRAAWSKDLAQDEFCKFAAMAKYNAARAARLHSGEAVQIFGALGLSDEETLEKMYRDAKMMEICEGTSEIQKNIIAHEVGA